MTIHALRARIAEMTSFVTPGVLTQHQAELLVEQARQGGVDEAEPRAAVEALAEAAARDRLELTSNSTQAAVAHVLGSLDADRPGAIETAGFATATGVNWIGLLQGRAQEIRTAPPGAQIRGLPDAELLAKLDAEVGADAGVRFESVWRNGLSLYLTYRRQPDDGARFELRAVPDDIGKVRRELATWGGVPAETSAYLDHVKTAVRDAGLDVEIVVEDRRLDPANQLSERVRELRAYEPGRRDLGYAAVSFPVGTAPADIAAALAQAHAQPERIVDLRDVDYGAMRFFVDDALAAAGVTAVRARSVHHDFSRPTTHLYLEYDDVPYTGVTHRFQVIGDVITAERVAAELKEFITSPTSRSDDVPAPDLTGLDAMARFRAQVTRGTAAERVQLIDELAYSLARDGLGAADEAQLATVIGTGVLTVREQLRLMTKAKVALERYHGSTVPLDALTAALRQAWQDNVDGAKSIVLNRWFGSEGWPLNERSPGYRELSAVVREEIARLLPEYEALQRDVRVSEGFPDNVDVRFDPRVVSELARLNGVLRASLSTKADALLDEVAAAVEALSQGGRVSADHIAELPETLRDDVLRLVREQRFDAAAPRVEAGVYEVAVPVTTTRTFRFPSGPGSETHAFTRRARLEVPADGSPPLLDGKPMAPAGAPGTWQLVQQASSQGFQSKETVTFGPDLGLSIAIASSEHVSLAAVVQTQPLTLSHPYFDETEGGGSMDARTINAFSERYELMPREHGQVEDRLHDHFTGRLVEFADARV